MEANKSLIVRVDNEIIDTDINDIDRITIDYNLEDVKEFQVKKSSEALSLKFPATLRNQRIFNTANNFSVENSEDGEVRKFSVEVSGDDIFIGKCILNKVHLRGSVPLYFEVNAFGNNADWILTLKESSLYDVIKNMPNHVNNYETVQRTWDFPNNFTAVGKIIPYVFAPVRYNLPIDADFGDEKSGNELTPKEGSFSILNMNPSISVKWLLEEIYKRAGFTIKSDFVNSEYFSRMVMPWTFGDFLTTEGSKYDVHKFLAVGRNTINQNHGGRRNITIDVDPDFTVDKSEKPNAFENNAGSFLNKSVKIAGKIRTTFGFEYKDNFDFGELNFIFDLSFYYKYRKTFRYEVKRYMLIEREKEGNIEKEPSLIYKIPEKGRGEGNFTHTEQVKLKKGDKVYIALELYVERRSGDITLMTYLDVKEFELKSITIPKDGEVIFDNFTVFQKYKTLDFIRGLCDLFNLSVQTNPLRKEVLIEPTHDYIIEGEKKQGFFTNDIIDWTEKQDYSQTSILELFNNASRNYTMRFKDDSSDVETSKIKDSFNVAVGSAKYVFSERFKEDDKVFENRFFSPTMHCKATTRFVNTIKDEEGKDIKQETPFVAQMVMIKTSDDGSTKNTISTPKIAYYKGKVKDAGQWVWRGEKQEDYPFMFAVNYNQGGEKDPVLSYSDENIDNGVVAKGLLRTFFLQRMAILNNGQVLSSPMVLTSSDVKNWYHREYIGLDGNKWEMINIREFSVIENETAFCTFRKWVPIRERDINNVYPSNESIKSGNFKKYNEFEDEKTEKDMRYFRLMEFLQQKPQPKTSETEQ